MSLSEWSGSPSHTVERLYLDMYQPLLAHLTRLVSDRAVAEDLCQDTFVKALRGWDQRDPTASASSWLYRIATNTAYDYLRRSRRIRFSSLADVDEPPVNDRPETRLEEHELVARALAQLPEMYRMPLVMHSLEGRSTHEIASRLGCSTSAVKTRLFRARERFREVYRA
ncbi:MAG: RNA polymerase sigma factor [Chloroflexi bacterium]|nr:RNA polymerase sigma factor [Chloroflexota bacterium]